MTSRAVTDAPALATRAGAEGLLPTLVVVVGVQAMVSSLGAPMIPTIAREFNVSVGVAQWALTGSLVMGAVATPLLGRLADFGRARVVLLAGLALVVAGSLVAGIATSFEVLLFGRVLQGIGLALAPVAMTIARMHTSTRGTAKAVGALSIAGVAGAGLSYPVTSFMTAHWGLSSAFWFAFVVACGALIGSFVFVPPDRELRRGKVDVEGAVLLAVATATILMTATEGEQWGWSSPGLTGTALVAGLSTLWWTKHTFETSEPLIDLRLAKVPNAASAHLAAFVVGAGLFFLLSAVMVLLQAEPPGPGLDRSVATAGLILVPYALSSVVGSRIAMHYEHRVARERWLPVGVLMYLAATGLIAGWHAHAWQVLAAMLVAGVGSGCTFTALPGIIVKVVPVTETGSSLAFNTVLRYLGFSVGSALAGVVISATSSTGTDISESGLKTALVVGAFIWAVALALTLPIRRGSLAAPRTYPPRS